MNKYKISAFTGQQPNTRHFTYTITADYETDAIRLVKRIYDIDYANISKIELIDDSQTRAYNEAVKAGARLELEVKILEIQKEMIISGIELEKLKQELNKLDK